MIAMVNENQLHGFYVKVCRSFMFDHYSFDPGERDIGWSKIGEYFVLDGTRDDVAARIRKLLPDPSPDEYRFEIRQAGEVGGVYFIN